MNATALMFDVPQVKQTRPGKADLRSFKEANSIKTHNSRGLDEPWSAIHMPSAIQIDDDIKPETSVAECAAIACRVLDEQGVLVTGRTERETIRKLCENLNIKCPL